MIKTPQATVSRLSGILLGFSHFAVDFCCTALLCAHTNPKSALLCAIIYNGLAFAFQLPVGAMADRLGQNRHFAILGCLTVACGGFAVNVPLLMSVILGLGNAFFHVGGGREALLRGGRKASRIGYFVAPGAIGIFLGPLCASLGLPITRFLPLPALICALLLLLRQPERQIEALVLPARMSGRKRWIVPVCLFLTVLLRAYMGGTIGYSFQQNSWMAMLFVLCIFGGKLLGGRFADRFGAFSFSLIAQPVATLLFVLSIWFPYCAFPAIFLFNTTMAVTAHRLYLYTPESGGMMFGLTTLALYFGTLPKLLGWTNPFFTWWGLLLLGLLSTCLLLLGLLPKGGKEDA